MCESQTGWVGDYASTLLSYYYILFDAIHPLMQFDFFFSVIISVSV